MKETARGERDAQALALFHEGLSSGLVAERLGLSQNYVRAIQRKAGP